MTNLAIDNFVRPDNPSGFGVASDGQAWVRDVGIGVSAIVANQGRVGPGGNDSHFLIGTGTTGTINLLCRIKSGGSGNVVAVLFRYSSTGGASVNGYRVGLFNSTLMVDRFVSGARTGIGSFATSYVIGEEWWVRAVAVGSTITCTAWKDGTSEPAPQLTLTDSSIASGQFGVSAFMSNDFVYFDSLTITDNQSPPVEQPTHAILTLTAARGTVAMAAARGALTLKAARGNVTLEGV